MGGVQLVDVSASSLHFRHLSSYIEGRVVRIDYVRYHFKSICWIGELLCQDLNDQYTKGEDVYFVSVHW